MIDKEYLTVDELIERWGCSLNDIHYLIQNCELIPSIAWNDYGIEHRWKITDGGTKILEELEELHERNFLRGWIYLRNPTPEGPLKYSFRYATIGCKDIYNEPWYLLLESNWQHQTPAVIRQEYIEINAVFMMKEVDACETIWQHRLGECAEACRHKKSELSSSRGESSKAEDSLENARSSSLLLPTISGKTFDKLHRAIEAYPVAYAGKKPKLDNDVRPWLISTFNCTEREAFVFGAIIAENYGLK